MFLTDLPITKLKIDPTTFSRTANRVNAFVGSALHPPCVMMMVMVMVMVQG